MERQCKKGFLLVEVLVAVMILSVGIVFTLRSFHHITALSRRSVQFFYSELQAEQIFLDMDIAFKTERGGFSSGKIKGEDILKYSVETEQLILDISSDEEVEEEYIRDPLTKDTEYQLATLTIKSGSAVLLDLPLVTKERGDEA